jgi:hypothetical protein
MSLDQRFEKFILSLPSIEGIDLLGLEKNTAKKADYLGMGRKIIFEQKSIIKNQAERVEKEIEKYVLDEGYPGFYGERDFNLVIEKLSNKEEIKRKVYTDTTKLLEAYLVQANKQIESTKSIFDISDATGVLIILNENIEILSPEVVSARIQQRLKELKGETSRFNNIDYVVFISETHTFKGLPIVITIEGHGAMSKPPVVSEYLDYLLYSWAKYNGRSYLQHLEAARFFENIEEKKEQIPGKNSQFESRNAFYRNNRYMKNWTDEEVAKAADEYVTFIQPFVMKGGPQLPADELAKMMMSFGDFIEESNIRGLDLREIKKLALKESR